ncbi:MAG: hypothetical protein CFK49_09795 [Armatimonadetes bacterium JP3_11]|nr:MAG: hypothetical protein CFK49_09795 [Armatimonadetes bacterium JP3_11]RMH06820.1 MAG: hypothetical protein D6697_09950 [Armatimonadota bacterium]
MQIMRLQSVCVWGLMLLLSASHAQPVRLSEDPLLQKPITVWLKLEPMREALQTIARETGVALRCQESIAQEKVALFVENRPAHEILTQLAQLFRYEWRRDPKGYTLFVPDTVRLEEEKILQRQREVHPLVLKRLVRIAREVRQMSPEQRQRERQALEQKPSRTSEEQERLAVVRMMLPLRMPQTVVNVETSFIDASYPVYYCLASLPDRALQTLIAGQTIGFSTRPANRIYPLPDDALFPLDMRDARWRPNESERFEEPYLYSPRNPEYAGLWLRYNAARNFLEYQLFSIHLSPYMSFQGNHEHLVLDKRMGLLSLSFSNAIEDDPLWRFWEQWSTPNEALLQAFPERALRTDREPPPQPKYRGVFSHYVHSPVVTTVDVLEQIAWATRQPIISDAFRQSWVRWEHFPLQTPRGALAKLTAWCWFRLSNAGYLLARHKWYWDHRTVELPEAWLRPLEQKYAQQKMLSIEDYVELAGKLGDAQVELFTHERSLPLTRFELEPLIECLPALRFLASLTRDQRNALATGEWLFFSRLNALQRRRFMESLNPRFPNAQQLFQEPIPQVPEAEPFGSQLWQGNYSKSTLEDLPNQPAVYLIKMEERRTPFLVDENGCIGFTTNLTVDEIDEDFSREMQEWLERNPGSRSMAARLRAWEIVFVGEGAQKHYLFVLSQYEPFNLSVEQKEDKP